MTTTNLTYVSDSGKSYDFNVVSNLNNLLINALQATGQLLPDNEYNFDFNHFFIEKEKFDAKMTYKKFTSYSTGIATVGDVIIGIENRDGNANVCIHQERRHPKTYGVWRMSKYIYKPCEVSAPPDVKNITGCGFEVFSVLHYIS